MLAAVWWWQPIFDFFDHHEGTAAWVQAVGAIIIILSTAWIAGQSSREAKEREHIAKQQLWESIAALARNCLDAIDTILQNDPQSPGSDALGSFLRSHAPSDFDVPTDGLAAVPLHQVGNADLVTAVLRLRGIMGHITRHLDDVRASKGVMGFSPDVVRSLRTPAFNAVAGVLRIVEGTAAEKEISRLAVRV
jgi:hypothetical protein